MKRRRRVDVERAARMYVTDRKAAEALGIHISTFHRLCQECGVETPNTKAARRDRTERYIRQGRETKWTAEALERKQGRKDHPWRGRYAGRSRKGDR